MKNASRFNSDQQLVLAEILKKGISFDSNAQYESMSILPLSRKNDVLIVNLLGLFALGLTGNSLEALTIFSSGNNKTLAQGLKMSDDDLMAVQMYGMLMSSIEDVRKFIVELKNNASSI